MRVIAGVARGTKLSALPGEDVTRPTVDRVKEAMFSSVQFLLPGAKVLDLFGGSGQLGIEAVSRGAEYADIVDQNAAAIRVITENCRATGLAAKCHIHSCEASSFLAACGQSYDIILMDPPYRHDTVAKLLPMVDKVTAPGGVIICETELEAKLPAETEGLLMKKQHHYGKILVTKYEKKG